MSTSTSTGTGTGTGTGTSTSTFTDLTGESLPFTGLNIFTLVLAGLVTLLVGVALRISARGHRTSETATR